MIRKLLSLVQIEHTLFALPLALTGAILAARGLPNWHVLALLAVAFTGARSAAMSFNRLVDRRLDALNPRTEGRDIPTGRITAAQAAALTAVSAAVFFLAAWGLNVVCLTLAPAALAVLLAYSYTKRFTWLCHVFLGLCLGLAPVAGCLAVSGEWMWAAGILGLGVVFWVAGFDVIYACQDVEFDRKIGLYSLPVRVGPANALRLATIFHLIAYSLFLAAGFLADLTVPFYVLSLVTAGLLWWEHRLVHPDDLSRLDLAFFQVNSMVSLSLLLAVSIGIG